MAQGGIYTRIVISDDNGDIIATVPFKGGLAFAAAPDQETLEKLTLIDEKLKVIAIVLREGLRPRGDISKWVDELIDPI